MATTDLSGKAYRHLQFLCREIDSRRVGSEGNRLATDYFARVLASHGFATESRPFDCMDWCVEKVSLESARGRFQAYASPYSPGIQVQAPLAVCSTIAELEAVEAENKLLLLRGELAKEQLMPKNFPFYNPEEHQCIIRLLEAGRPAAVLTATGRNPEMAGAVYPFPLIEDGDFDLPSAYMTEEEGERLAEEAGCQLTLDIQARRIPSRGCNVSGRKGAEGERRVVLTAHIDAKAGSPGALDNATGVATLLLLAELLQTYTGGLQVELTAISGEDYYSVPGEMLFLRENEGWFGEIVLGINLDGVGFIQGKTAYSLYGCPPEISDLARQTFASFPDLMEGEPWYQGDHSMFIMHERPALAFTSENAMEILTRYAHSPQDTPEAVDPEKLAALASGLHNFLRRLNEMPVQ